MTKAHAAFELGREGPAAEFRPALGTWDRVSVAWWADTDPDHERGPLFTEARATLVVVWPTDALGMLLADQFEQASVQWWSPNDRQYEQLTKLHRDFPLGRHDLVLRLDRMRPHNMSGLFAVSRSREPELKKLAKAMELERRRLLG